mmetsp:Transcript_15725/g.50416  ORF Transcript_15725/g.50416 Transcript_15725/m.50416 type:complete len:303 (+) Transcript_15725:1350-2258(+)
MPRRRARLDAHEATVARARKRRELHVCRVHRRPPEQRADRLRHRAASRHGPQLLPEEGRGYQARLALAGGVHLRNKLLFCASTSSARVHVQLRRGQRLLLRQLRRQRVQRAAAAARPATAALATATLAAAALAAAVRGGLLPRFGSAAEPCVAVQLRPPALQGDGQRPPRLPDHDAVRLQHRGALGCRLRRLLARRRRDGLRVGDGCERASDRTAAAAVGCKVRAELGLAAGELGGEDALLLVGDAVARAVRADMVAHRPVGQLGRAARLVHLCDPVVDIPEGGGRGWRARDVARRWGWQSR